MKRMAIQLTVTSNLPWAATLTAITLTPQHGFRLDPPNGPIGNPCPLILNPGSTASAVMFVTSKLGGRSVSRSNMLRGGVGQGDCLVCSVLYLVDAFQHVSQGACLLGMVHTAESVT